MKIFCLPFGSSRGNFNLPPTADERKAPGPRESVESYKSTSSRNNNNNNNGVKVVPAPTPVAVIPEEEEERDKENENDEPVRPIQQKREGIIAESRFKDTPTTAEDIETKRFSKDASTETLIKGAIMRNEFLANLDPAQVDAIVEAMYHKNYKAKSYVITEGEPGSHLYVSHLGDYEVLIGGKHVSNFGPGTAFGELAILYNAKRMASIKALTEAKVWVLDRREFQKIMMRTGLQRREENVKFLRSVPLLQKLNSDTLTKMSDLLQVEFYKPGTKIVKQGDRGDVFYIISGGNVRVTKREPNSTREEDVVELGKGDYFGELALLKDDLRQATVTALAPGVECLILERGPFVELLGHLPDLEKYNNISPKASADDSQKPKIAQEYDYINLNELDPIGTLGVGGFGRVELVQYRKDKKLTFALKCLKKVYVVEQQQEEHAYNEKAVMLQCKECPFICKLFRTYRDAKYVYFLMEPCLGGDVFTVLQNNRFFDDRTARFMTACVVEALEYLHGHGFIFRDLKPENLMLDSRGYIKMIDFGFAKALGSSGKTWTFAGTPEYVAPEIIRNTGHDRAVDYWALGVLMHEFLTGRPPFRGTDHMKTYNLILKGIEAVEFPKYVQRAALHLIRRLCRATATERLGYQKAGVKDIKAHKWFQGFDWVALKNRSMKAPIVQQINGPTDISKFDKYKKDNEIPPDEFSGWDKDF